MTLATGDQLGPYVITGTLGAGGMGEVYRARDPRLNRDVAIKILRGGAFADPDARARFVHEARAVSALSHPNIVTIFDIGAEGDVVYMVMELVDGQPLERILPAGGMRLGEVLRIGAQIADACAKAHAAGVVHRDLKPANVMIQPDGRVRVLDFGIAKLIAPVAAADATAASDATGTSPGMVLGTAAYMSPEQAEGRQVDGRSDIFSLGAMLYEMCTGQRPFKGDSPVTVMAAVLQQEPAPIVEVRRDAPPEFARLVMRCLRKDPARRVQSMADLKVALEELREDADSGRLSAQQPMMVRRGRGFTTAALVATIVGAAVLFALLKWPQSSSHTEDALQPVPLTSFAGTEAEPTFSPDGSQVAFRWNGDDQTNHDIYVMLIGGGSPLRLTTDPRTDFGPQWSPDGRRIAFLRVISRARIAVMLVPPLGGPERAIGEFANTLALGGAPLASLCWTPDSRYLFLSAGRDEGEPNRIMRLTVDTGDVIDVTVATDKGRGFVSPDLSPDGRTLAMAHLDATDPIQLVSLSDTFEPVSRRVVPGGRNVGSVHWTPDGRDLLITYFLALPLTLFRVPLTGGEPVPLSWVGPGAGSGIAIHGARMIFERQSRDTNIVRVDLRSGATPVVDRIAQSSFRDVSPQYSPDGTRLAFHSNRSGTVQIWVSNADGTQAMQLTTMDSFATTGTPRWSPDGRQIAFDSNAGGFYQIYVVPSSGGRPRVLTSGNAQSYCATWSPDARWIYFSSNRAATEVWRVPAGGGTAEQITHVGASQQVISRDGKWLYYIKGEGGDGIWRVPIDGGAPEPIVSDRVFRYNYALVDGGIYYVAPNQNGSGGAVRYFDFATKATRQIVAIDKPLDLGLTVSPDGRYLLFAQIDYIGQDLMLVENFR